VPSIQLTLPAQSVGGLGSSPLKPFIDSVLSSGAFWGVSIRLPVAAVCDAPLMLSGLLLGVALLVQFRVRCSPLWTTSFLADFIAKHAKELETALAELQTPGPRSLAANRECVELINRAASAITEPDKSDESARVRSA
jgi:hypothetical protein